MQVYRYAKTDYKATINCDNGLTFDSAEPFVAS